VQAIEFQSSGCILSADASFGHSKETLNNANFDLVAVAAATAAVVILRQAFRITETTATVITNKQTAPFTVKNSNDTMSKFPNMQKCQNSASAI